MGKGTHGPYLIAAIEYGDIEKVSHILSTKFRDKSKVKAFLASEVRRLACDYVEVPLMLAATLADPTIIKYFVTKHDANVNFVYEYGHQVYQQIQLQVVIFRMSQTVKYVLYEIFGYWRRRPDVNRATTLASGVRLWMKKG